jgi:beta-lactam-binding protein with PASTA domain/tetratricopeptide (TPR) repeat protein
LRAIRFHPLPRQHHPRLPALAVVLCAAGLAFGARAEVPQPGDAGPPPIAQIEQIVVGGTPTLKPAAGDVRVVRAEQLVSARPALPLFENDEILTGPDVTVTILCLEEVAEEDKTVFVGAASQIRIRSQRSIFLILGRILANVRGRFDVATARATLGSRSTEFEVRVGEDGATHLAVLEGVVDVQRSEEVPLDVARGRALDLARDRLLSRPRLVRAAFSSQRLPQPAAVGRLEEVTIQKGEPATKVVPAAEERVRGILAWSVDAELAGRPATAAKRVIPHFESAAERTSAFRKAKFDAAWRRDPGSYETLGKVYSDWEQGAKSVEAFSREAEVNPAQQKSATFQASLGEALRMKGRWTEAEQQLLKARTIEPGNARVSNGLGNVYFAQAAAAQDTGSFDAATSLLEKCVNLYAETRKGRTDTAVAPNGIAWANDGEAKMALGDIARQQNRLDTAAERYEEGRRAFVRASTADPRYVFAAVGVADSTRRIGSVARSRGDEQQAKQAYREAESAYRKLIDAQPDLSAAHVGLGDLYLEAGLRTQAIDSYTRAVMLRPDQAVAHLRLGLALADQNPRLAAESAQTYVALEQRGFKQGQRLAVANKIIRLRADKPIGPTVPPSTTKPPSDLRVPKVEDLGRDDAVRSIEAFGYRVGRIENRESSKPPGTVLDQKPDAGKRADAGTPIDLVVAVPRMKTIEVPDVVGDSRERAVQKLREKGLVAGSIAERPGCDEPGKVLAQEPAEDARVQSGTAVALVISGAGGRPVRVPQLTGLPLAQAERALRERDLQIRRIDRRPTDQARPDTVLIQAPRGDALVPAGCPIDVVVAVALPRVRVPNFIGMTEAQARRELQRSEGGSGLTLGRVVQRQQRGTPGTVVAQDPPPDSLVDVNTPVHLAVIPQSSAPPQQDLVLVPDLRNQMRKDAEARLRQVGLRTEVRVQYSRQHREGQVISQSHIGQRVPPSTVIQLVVATTIG